MDLLKFMRKKKRAARKHKKYVHKAAVSKDKTKSQLPKLKVGERYAVRKGKEMILVPGKDTAPLFIADAKSEAIEGELLDADSQYMLQKLGKETSISSYVYVVPAAPGRPAMVDLTIDGVWGFVRICAEKKIK